MPLPGLWQYGMTQMGDSHSSLRSPFLESVRHAIRVKHYARSTEKAYIYWVRYFIRYHRLRHPKDMHSKEVSAFLT